MLANCSRKFEVIDLKKKDVELKRNCQRTSNKIVVITSFMILKLYKFSQNNNLIVKKQSTTRFFNFYFIYFIIFYTKLICPNLINKS
jgi:hypothetical protein